MAAIEEQMMKAGDPHPRDVDAGPASSLGVAADGVEVPAEAGAAEDERPEEQEHDHHGQHPRDAADLETVAGLGERFALSSAVMPSTITPSTTIRMITRPSGWWTSPLAESVR